VQVESHTSTTKCEWGLRTNGTNKTCFLSVQDSSRSCLVEMMTNLVGGYEQGSARTTVIYSLV